MVSKTYFANKRQVKQNLSSLGPSIPFHFFVDMVDSEDITLKKLRQVLSLEIKTLSDTFQHKTFVKENSSRTSTNTSRPS